MPESNIHGKETPNGFLSWGATLYDFYYVRTIPLVENLITMTSGSRIAAAVRAIGETDAAVDELAWADQEEHPREVPVVDPGELALSAELRISLGAYDEFSAVDEVRTRATAKGDNKPTEQLANDGNTKVDGCNGVSTIDLPRNSALASVLMPGKPLSSPFHPSHYPPPWPFVPFSNSDTSTLLQKRIPLHLLPETLFVHDPYNVLSATTTRDSSPERNTAPWFEKPPKVHQYKLSLTSSANQTVIRARREAEKEEKKKARILHVYQFPPTEEERARGEPTYEVPLPTQPPALTQVEEGHLYLSPAGKMGVGHHSVVYKAEFELPRSLFLEPKICTECVFEELQKEVGKLKASGKWRIMLRAAGCELPHEDEDEDMSDENQETPIFPELNEEFDREQITVISRTLSYPMSWTPPPELTPCIFRVYCPDIQWQDPKAPCKHTTRHHPCPRTAMFRVAAKLSFQNDTHLEREAKNYQKFPDHFFQHWNGYNLIRPLHGPVPVHALVPQFYGHYVPDNVPTPTTSSDRDASNESGSDNEAESDEPAYLSPILLLEDCGTPVDPAKLSKDDREECVSLLLRFNNAGWLHDSIWARNFLVQKGPPTMWPLERATTDQLSFRLIDFGRSRFVEEPKGEEFRVAFDEAMDLFKILHGSFQSF